MIFRLNGGVENVLALTPVIEEWKRRNKSPVKVETFFPELLWGNPCVDEAAKVIDSEENHAELGFVRWPLLVKSVMLGYAEKVLGDVDMECWRTKMFNTPEEESKAKAMRPSGRVAAVSLGKGVVDEEVSRRVAGVVESEGYKIMDVGGEPSLRLRRAMVSISDVFVGVDGPTASLAYTTDVPAVVIHTWRDPLYFWPFRKGIPFAALAPSEMDCPMARICLANNGLSEYGKVYGCRCPMEPSFACGKVPFDMMVKKALEDIFMERL